MPLFRLWSSSQNIYASNYATYLLLPQTPWASNIYASNSKQAQPSHLTAAHIAVLKFVYMSALWMCNGFRLAQSLGHGPYVCYYLDQMLEKVESPSEM